MLSDREDGLLTAVAVVFHVRPGKYSSSAATLFLCLVRFADESSGKIRHKLESSSSISQQQMATNMKNSGTRNGDDIARVGLNHHHYHHHHHHHHHHSPSPP